LSFLLVSRFYVIMHKASKAKEPSSTWYADIPSKLITWLPSDLFSNFWNNRKKETEKTSEWIESNRRHSDSLDLQHFGNVEGLIPTGKRNPGAGHAFVEVQLTHLTWCDKCGDFIWSLFRQAMRCEICHYTCHYKCRSLVTLDCRSVSDSLSSKSTELTLLSNSGVSFDAKCSTDHLYDEVLNLDEEDQYEECYEGPVSLHELSEYKLSATGPNLLDLIVNYNEKAGGLTMTLDDNAITYRGFIKILINFSRPVNTVDILNQPSCYDITMDGDVMISGGSSKRLTLTSFYLPRNCVKTLHISSDTTTQEMIVSMLKKFHIVDNPRKFAFYERDLQSGKTLQAKLRRIPDEACPLEIALLWGPSTNKRFVLQENETGEIMWDSFEIPELNNFLKILEIEENQYIDQIQEYYRNYRLHLQREIQNREEMQCVEASDGILRKNESFTSYLILFVKKNTAEVSSLTESFAS
ncbi:Ras association domain-containing protein 1, partial [Trichinella zimbabwensis]